MTPQPVEFTSSPRTETDLKTLEAALQSWKLSLPDDFKTLAFEISSATPTAEKTEIYFRANLQIYYRMCVILLHKPKLMNQLRKPQQQPQLSSHANSLARLPCFTACHTAACEITTILEIIRRHNPHMTYFMPFVTAFAVFQSALVHLISGQVVEGGGVAAVSAAQVHLGALEGLSRDWGLAGKLHGNLKGLVDVARDAAVSISNVDAKSGCAGSGCGGRGPGCSQPASGIVLADNAVSSVKNEVTDIGSIESVSKRGVKVESTVVNAPASVNNGGGQFVDQTSIGNQALTDLHNNLNNVDMQRMFSNSAVPVTASSGFMPMNSGRNGQIGINMMAHHQHSAGLHLGGSNMGNINGLFNTGMNSMNQMNTMQAMNSINEITHINPIGAINSVAQMDPNSGVTASGQHLLVGLGMSNHPNGQLLTGQGNNGQLLTGQGNNGQLLTGQGNMPMFSGYGEPNGVGMDLNMGLWQIQNNNSQFALDLFMNPFANFTNEFQ
ncbi:hypothetical protein HK100_008766 [Physocladia obscura]|uniref:Uncharacterized protein n=1 Tax=Physocladia obscura TaxID=109957 RepID=A0AAD5SN60_9FUNG|nr:hypothetical protein HK100_008766 [Physocladia obscura]